MTRMGIAVKAAPVVHLAQRQAAMWAVQTQGTVRHPLLSSCSLAVVSHSTCTHVILKTRST